MSEPRMATCRPRTSALAPPNRPGADAARRRPRGIILLVVRTDDSPFIPSEALLAAQPDSPFQRDETSAEHHATTAHDELTAVLAAAPALGVATAARGPAWLELEPMQARPANALE
eukprot:5411152-Alexandrium_andersonii.AAC.1